MRALITLCCLGLVACAPTFTTTRTAKGEHDAAVRCAKSGKVAEDLNEGRPAVIRWKCVKPERPER